MTTGRVLAVSRDLDQMRALVADIERAGGLVDARSSIPTESHLPHRLAFLSVDEGNFSAAEGMLARLPDSAEVAVLVPAAQLQDLSRFLSDPRVNHVLVGDEIERSTFITARKLISSDIFGIEKYLPEGTDVHYLRLRDFAGRGNAIDSIVDYASECKMRRPVRSAIASVCEELLMNALYDAPVDVSGNQVFAEIDPHDRTTTSSPRPVSIRYAATEDGFAVAVRDRFGRLAKNTVLAYIDKCLQSPNQLDRKTYGAGLGLYLVANAAASFVVNVAHGIATEVICSFDRTTKAPLRLVGVFIHPDHDGVTSSAEPARGSA